MSKRNLLSLTIVASAVAFAPSAYAAPTTVEDQDFANADWTVVVLKDDTPGTDALGLGAQVTNGLGDPDNYRSVIIDWTNDGVNPATVVTGQMNVASASVYSPATDGPIGSIEFALAVETLDSNYPDPTTLAFFPVVKQGTVFFAADGGSQSTAQWSPLAWGPWIAADFTPFSGSGATHLDFTSNGTPLTFGIAVEIGPLPQTGGYSLDGGIDNWKVTLNEPSDGGPGGAGGAGGGSGAGGTHSTTIPPAVGPEASAILPRSDCSCRIGDQSAGSSSAALLLGLGALGALGRGARRRRNG